MNGSASSVVIQKRGWIRPTDLALAVGMLIVATGSTTAGSPRMQTYFAGHFTDTAYQQKVLDKVAKGWTVPEEFPPEGAKCVWIVQILREGKILEPKLNHKSGSETWDSAALAAIKGAAPFEALPASYAGSSVEVHFHFENVKPTP